MSAPRRSAVRSPRYSRQGSRTPWRACLQSRRSVPWYRRAPQSRRRAVRTCRRRAPRRYRSTRCEIADCPGRGHVAVHGVEALEYDQLGAVACRAQQRFEMRHVVVAEDLLLATGLAHALDHRVVVERVRQDHAVRDEFGQRRDAGLIGDVARGEDERCFLVMEVSKFTLELDERVVGACNVAGAARSGAHAGRGLDHGAYYLGMLAHAEIIVRAPDHDVACAMGGMPSGAWKAAGVALEVGNNSIPALVRQVGQRLREMSLIIHRYIRVNHSNLELMLLSRSQNNQESSFEARTVLCALVKSINPSTSD